MRKPFFRNIWYALVVRLIFFIYTHQFPVGISILWSNSNSIEQAATGTIPVNIKHLTLVTWGR